MPHTAEQITMIAHKPKTNNLRNTPFKTWEKLQQFEKLL